VDRDGEDFARPTVFELARDEGERAPQTLARDDVLVGDYAAHVSPTEEVVGESDRSVVRVRERLLRSRAVGAASVVYELALYGLRSEERRVGKECSSRWPSRGKQNTR